MRTLLTIFFIGFVVLIQGQNTSNNDYFALNLKNKPNSIKEISFFSFHDYFSPEYINLLDSSLISNLQIWEVSFDSLGRISNEFCRNSSEPDGLLIKRNYNSTQYYTDSIVTTEVLPNGIKTFHEKKLLNSAGFDSLKIVDYPFSDTLKIWRDSLNRLTESYNHSVVIDSYSTTKIRNTYNENGDIETQRKIVELHGALLTSPEIESTFTELKYIYDSHRNWIVRVTFSNDKIILMTQRQIEY